MRVLHRWCGLALALLLMFSGLTGSILAFEPELDAWLNPELFRAQPGGTPLDVDQLIAHVEASDPRLRVSLLRLDDQPGHSVQALVAARPGPAGRLAPLAYNRVFIDPVTGRIQGRRLWGAWTLDRVHALPLIDRLHRTLTLPGRWGNWIMGGAALGWLGLSVLGFCLSLPRLGTRQALHRPGPAQPGAQSFWQRWRPAWRIKRGATGYRYAHDLHRAAGLWTLPLALAFALTGVYLNLGNEVFKPVVSLIAPITPAPLDALPPASSVRSGAPLSAVAAIGHARAWLPAAASGYQPWFLSHLPDRGVYRVAFKEPGLREQAFRVRSEQVFIDDRSGALRGLTGYASGQAGDRLLQWQYPVHTGKVLGLAGRVLAAFGGLAVGCCARPASGSGGCAGANDAGWATNLHRLRARRTAASQAKSGRMCENNNHSHPGPTARKCPLQAIELNLGGYRAGVLVHISPVTVSHSSTPMTLDQTALGQRLVVRGVTSPAAAPEWARWLDEIGFIAGEQVMLMARGAIGGDPLVVRVGTSTFALRRAEAACVRVEPAAT